MASTVKKVLVLCQRRDGEGTEGVHESIVRLSKGLLGEEVEIAYLSNKDGLVGYTDMSFLFGHNKQTDQLERNYDLIITNTCPARDMNYKRIHLHLKEGGYLAVATYDKNKHSMADPIFIFLQKNRALPMIINAGFVFRKVLKTYDAVLFQKNGDDHTDYFKSTKYDDYTLPDKSEATKKHEIEREKRSRDNLNQKLMDMFRNSPVQAGDAEDVSKAEPTASIPDEDDDMYTGGIRKTRKRKTHKRKTRKRKTRK